MNDREGPGYNDAVKRRPRMIRKFFAFLVLGAIVNVAVAWGMSVFSREGGRIWVGYHGETVVLRSGAPCLCLTGRAERLAGWTPFEKFEGCISIDSSEDKFLPLVPLWPGFAINTVFYAAVLWLLFAGPGKIHRRIRARRGQCPACAYPIGTSDVCTECGGPVTPRPGGAMECSHG